MWSKFLIVLAILLGAIGTVKAILSVLKMKLQDVIYTRSALGYDTSELTTLRQVYDARVGIVLVILSVLVQVFCEICDYITFENFCIVSGIVLVIASAHWFFMYIIYKKNEAFLLDEMPDQVKNELRKTIMGKRTLKKSENMSKYDQLLNEVKGEASLFNFENVNSRIDEIILNKNQIDKVKEVKSLICHFEGKANKSNVYAIFTICFALLISVISNVFILFIIFILGIIAIGVLHRDYKVSFILKILNFKLEELEHQSTDDKEMISKN